MVATPVVAQSSSSKQLIQGCPAPLAFYGDLFLNLETYLGDILEDARKSEVSRIQGVLPQKDSRWDPIAKDFRITWDSEDNSFAYGTLPESQQEAMDIEFGSPAKSIIRHEILTANRTLGAEINKRLKRLAETGRSK
jgi:hypothetical protein